MLRSNRDLAKAILLPVKVSSRETNTILQTGSQTNDFAGQRYLSFMNCRRVEGNHSIDILTRSIPAKIRLRQRFNFLDFVFVSLKLATFSVYA